MASETASQARDIELRSSNANDSTFEIAQADLPPADGGREAWLVLAGCSLIQAPVWGLSLAFGVLQEYYSDPRNAEREKLHGDTSRIPVIGTTATGLLYLTSPLTFYFLTRFPHFRSLFGPMGLFLTVVAYLLSSFATQVWQLIATQGVLGALGTGLLFAPTTLYLDEWWLRRKGLAYGVMWSSKSLVGALLPFAFEGGLSKIGAKWTVRAWCLVVFLLAAPLLHSLRPRLPLSRSSSPRRMDFSFLHLPAFWLLQTGNILQSLGYFLPSAYLSTYATSTLHLPRTTSTALLALLNGTSVAGSLLIGLLNDRLRVGDVVLISTVGSSLAVFLFWGLGGHVAMLVAFSMLYGFFAGGFSSTWSGVLREVRAESEAVDTGLVFGLLAGGRGIGNVVSGPLSVALLEGGSGWKGATAALATGSGWGYGTEYGPMIAFTGVSAVLGGWGWLTRWKISCGGRARR